MSRRSNGAGRCGGCRLPMPLCVCPLLPNIRTSTRLLLVVHREEERKTTTTGLLAARCLVGSRVVVIGDRARPAPASVLEAGERAAVLFPHPEALPLERLANGAPLTLVVPDGSWRQAAKMARRAPGVAGLPLVSLPAGPPSGYRLRAEPRAGGLATLEAIARAIAVLEGAAVVAPLLEAFACFVDRTLWLRGALADHEVRGGLPAAAIAAGVRGHASTRRATGGA